MKLSSPDSRLPDRQPQRGSAFAACTVVALLFIVGVEATAEPLWTVPQAVVLPLTGEIRADTGGRGFVVSSGSGGDFAVTDAAVLGVDTTMHELVSGDDAWLTLRGIATGILVRKSSGSGLVPVDPCPDLLPGVDSYFGNVHCSNGALRRMDGLAVIAVYSPPAGYRVIDIWSESSVVLERDSDHALVVGAVRESPPVIEPTTSLGVVRSDLDERLALVRYLSQPFPVYRSGSQYRVVRFGSFMPPVAAVGKPVPGQQCIAGDISANRLVAIEREAGELQLRTYSTSTPGQTRVDPLQDGDRLVCASTSASGSFTGPHVLRANPQGDQLFRATSTGLNLIYTAADPVRGAGQLLSAGQVIFVRFADRSIFPMIAAGALSEFALVAPHAFPRPIEAGTLATDPVREYALSGAPESGMAQLSISERAPFTGAALATTDLPLGVDLRESALTSVYQVLRHPDWPAQRQLVALNRRAIGTEPAGGVYYSIQGTQPPAPFLDSNGAQPAFSNLVLSGERVHALRSATPPTTLMRFGSDGSYQGQTALQASQLVGQRDGSVLAVRATPTEIVVARIATDAIIWERSFGNTCRVLDLEEFPLVSCQQGGPSLSTLFRLDPHSGATVWQRLVTPLDLQLPFDARVAWTQDGELRTLSWALRAGARQLCVARVNPGNGALLGVSNVLSLTANSVQAQGVHGFPYTHRWIHLLRLEGPQRQRIALRVDSNGTISPNLLGQSFVTESVYLSEGVDRITTNEGPRWFSSSQVQGASATSAQVYPQSTLALPLSLSHSVIGSPGRDDRASVRIEITNANASEALAARIHVSLLECPGNHQSATLDLNIPAASTRELYCAAHFGPDAPLDTVVFLRQALNGPLIRDFVSMPITVGSLLRGGFEGDSE